MEPTAYHRWVVCLAIIQSRVRWCFARCLGIVAYRLSLIDRCIILQRL